MKHSVRYSLLCAALFLGGGLWASAAWAHSIYIFAYQKNSQICTNSYFGGKAKVRGGRVSMIGMSGEVLGTAQTDEQGNACFARPEILGDLLFRVEAGSGHQGEFNLPASDIGAGESSPASEESGRAAAGSPAEPAASAVPSTPCAAGISGDDLNKAIFPIMLKLAEMESMQNSRVTLRDIVGGLGWIIGLAGAALWAAGRKNTAATKEGPL